MTTPNGHPRSQNSSRHVGAVSLGERAALIMLWLAKIDGNDEAVDRALTLLGPEVRPVAAALWDLAVRIQPMLRTQEARENALTELARADTAFRVLTGR